MENIAERIKKIRKGLNLSQKELAESLELSQGVISSIENGRRNVSRNVLMALGTQFNINANWILTGQGEMFMPRQISAFKSAEQLANNIQEAVINSAGLLESSPPPETEATAEPPAEFSAKEKANTRAAITMLENAAQSIEAAVKLLKESMGGIEKSPARLVSRAGQRSGQET